MSQVHSQQGVGLVEVLVAVLLLSVAVLGFSALQLQAIKATEESLVRTQALSVVRGLAENMRANPLQLKEYEDTINAQTLPADVNCGTLEANCTADKIAIKEANAAVKKLKEYDIKINMATCPSDINISEFSKIKCIIAAWGDTEPVMSDADNACATSLGVYKSSSNCVIVEAY